LRRSMSLKVAAYLMLILVWLILQPWRWRRHFLLKRGWMFDDHTELYLVKQNFSCVVIIPHFKEKQTWYQIRVNSPLFGNTKVFMVDDEQIKTLNNFFPFKNIVLFSSSSFPFRFFRS
jgi:hypothetical protein